MVHYRTPISYVTNYFSGVETGTNQARQVNGQGPCLRLGCSRESPVHREHIKMAHEFSRPACAKTTLLNWRLFGFHLRADPGCDLFSSIFGGLPSIEQVASRDPHQRRCWLRVDRWVVVRCIP